MTITTQWGPTLKTARVQGHLSVGKLDRRVDFEIEFSLGDDGWDEGEFERVLNHYRKEAQGFMAKVYRGLDRPQQVTLAPPKSTYISSGTKGMTFTHVAIFDVMDDTQAQQVADLAVERAKSKGWSIGRM
jgi:hypothetical protein